MKLNSYFFCNNHVCRGIKQNKSEINAVSELKIRAYLYDDLKRGIKGEGCKRQCDRGAMSFLARMQSQRANGTSLFALSPMYMGCSAHGPKPKNSHSPLRRPNELAPTWDTERRRRRLLFGVDGGRAELQKRRRQEKRTRALAAVEEKGALACRTLKDAAAAAGWLGRSLARCSARGRELPISALAPALYPIISPLCCMLIMSNGSERTKGDTPRPEDNIGQIMSKCFLNQCLSVFVHAADQMHTQDDLKSKWARQTRFAGERFLLVCARCVKTVAGICVWPAWWQTATNTIQATWSIVCNGPFPNFANLCKCLA